MILHNFGDTDFTITKGDRIAQLILELFESPSVVTKDSIDEIEHGGNCSRARSDTMALIK